MLYRPLWFALFFIYRVFFRRFYTSGFENIVKNKPIIFVGNHVNAFLDPLMMPTQFWKKGYFIVRGDIFNTPLKRWALWQTHQLPIFRGRDGKENILKNDATYEKSYELLGKNNWIVIFPEGDCVQEKHLRPIKKGTTRMAFGAMEKYGWNIDLHLVPNTQNYSHPANFRSEVMVNVGKPIRLLDYKELYEQGEAKALNKLTKDIQEGILKIYIHIENRADLQLFEDLIEIERNNNPQKLLPWKPKDHDRFKREQKVANHINFLRETNETELEKIKSSATSYHNKLKYLGLNDNYLGNFKPNVVLGVFFSLLFLPVFIIGYLLNIIQFKVADYFAINKIKLIHFKNSIRLGFLLVINLLVMLILMIVISFYNITLAFALPFIVLLLAWITITYKEQILIIYNFKRFQKIENKNKVKVDELRKLRSEIWDTLNK